jgi:hypothetical protein
MSDPIPWLAILSNDPIAWWALSGREGMRISRPAIVNTHKDSP